MLIYIHIPFCEQKCNYCAFNSFSDINHLKNEYFSALPTQLRHDLEFYDIKKNSVTSVFIGGGTPSSVSADLYEHIFNILSFYITDTCEITSEANPNSATKNWLKKMKGFGLNRISFGVQSFNDEKLNFLGRIHTNEVAKKAVLNAHDIGFKNISIDLMYGTKYDDKKNLENELKNTISLPIQHVSAYSLMLEKNTPFYQKTEFQNDDEVLARYFANSLCDAGFNQYEISNFGKTCKHNYGYWQHKPYLGIGAGAVGYVDKKRLYPNRDVKAYMENSIHKDIENLSSEDIATEKIFLGLRSSIGIESSILSSQQIKRAEFLVDEKKLLHHNNRYFAKDFFLADEIALYLI